MKRRIFAILLSLTMMFTLVPTAWALNEEENRTSASMETSENGEGAEESGSVAPAMRGNCGAVGSEDSVQWALADDDGDGSYTLTISGDGAMANYTANINNEKRPHNPGEQVKQVLKSKRLPKWLCPKVLLLLVPSRLTA